MVDFVLVVLVVGPGGIEVGGDETGVVAEEFFGIGSLLMEGYEGPDGDAGVADAGVATADAGSFLDAAGVEFGAQQFVFLGGEGVDDLDQGIDQLGVHGILHSAGLGGCITAMYGFQMITGFYGAWGADG